MNETLALSIRLLMEAGFEIVRIEGEQITVRPRRVRA